MTPGMLIQKARAAIKAIVPLSARRALVKARHKVRAFTAGSRILPDFVIIGCQRGGTSSLYTYLGQHPDIAPSLRKETEYLTVRYQLGEDWYRAHFPHRLRRWIMAKLGRRLLTFEATPDYLLDPRAAARCAEILPDARIVVLLREPGERAFSQYHHNLRLGLESETFETAIELETIRLEEDLDLLAAGTSSPIKEFRNHSYLRRGEYAEQLERWFDVYPREQILVLESERFFAQPADVLEQILEFVGAKHWLPQEFRNYSYLKSDSSGQKRLPEELRAKFDQRFAEPNRALRALLDEEIEWLTQS